MNNAELIFKSHVQGNCSGDFSCDWCLLEAKNKALQECHKEEKSMIGNSIDTESISKVVFNPNKKKIHERD